MERPESSFKTPCKVERRKSSGEREYTARDVTNNNTSLTGSSQSPSFAIPASPFMKKFGYGTGVSVYLMKR
ncbi:hypothetical protein GDO81_018779 [Engystomops pustulosus]|uniref:Uncharacterized protein n=1 Tax=Engystomops pustulosus TaxID=76066 RepID=A0AAV6YD22_ENGPU|nr:hypothetical protein GDO81_018779 [Engystomops pustulosus]